MTSEIVPQAVGFFDRAYEEVVRAGFQREIDWVENNPPLEKQTSQNFEREYVWVVLNAGMKEQVTRKIYDRFWQRVEDYVEGETHKKPWDLIGHPGKREAIHDFAKYGPSKRFAELLAAHDKLAYLESLPWIGKITKYHLARNMGIDVVKPDRWLVRMARAHDFYSPDSMCKEIQRHRPHYRIGTIDLILWRYGNLTGKVE